MARASRAARRPVKPAAAAARRPVRLTRSNQISGFRTGAFGLVAEVATQVAVVDRLQEVRHGLKVLLAQGGEFIQKPKRRIYEVRKVALATGWGFPVVAGKGAPALAIVGVPFSRGKYVVSAVVTTAL